MSDNVQKVLDCVQPSTFISKFVRLKLLHNRQFVGLCPFHQEKSPSFRVNDEKRFFYCFGCGKGGDILNFLQEHKGISFADALTEIASEYGIKLESWNSEKQEQTKSKQEFLLEIANIFHKTLFTSKGLEALDYLTKKRKLNLEIIKNFKLGFSPKESDFLISYFPNKIEDLLNFGLIGKRENSDFYSTFSDRIIFPITDNKGGTIAFGSRIYKKSQEDAKLAKYINSKEHELFKKSRVIYGFEKAKISRKPPILVEGYFDVITMHQFGFTSAVAQMGTAFSLDQLGDLFLLQNEVIFCYDSDEAGQKAEKRSIELALPILTPEKNISFLTLEAKDCDEFLHQFGKEKMQEKIQNRTPLYKKIFEMFSKKTDFTNPEQASFLESELIKFCNGISNSILKKNYISYFKNQIFLTKVKAKKAEKQKFLVAKKSKINAKDGILFLLLKNFPEVMESDFYLEHFVPFESKDIEKELYFTIQNPQAYSEITMQIEQNYKLENIKNVEDAMEFYKKIYSQFLAQKIQKDINNALQNQNFTKAKLLKEELEKFKNSSL